MDNCPKCKISFKGEPIPEEHRQHYGDDVTHYGLEIGIDGGYMGIYDGIVAYRCHSCSHKFPRGESTWAKEMFEKYQKVCRGESVEHFDKYGRKLK